MGFLEQPAEQQAASQDAELQIAVAQERLEMFYKKNVLFLIMLRIVLSK